MWLCLKGYFDEFLLDHKAEFPFDVSPEAVGEAPVVGVARAHSYYGRGCFCSFSFLFQPNHRNRKPPKNVCYTKTPGYVRGCGVCCARRYSAVMQMEALTFGGGGGMGGSGMAGDGLTGSGMSEQEGGSLMPPLRLHNRGDKALTVKIIKMGFKDATDYIDPFITMSVVNKSGWGTARRAIHMRRRFLF